MSLTAAVIRELVAAGVTGDALVAACERIESADGLRTTKAVDEQAERRRAADRERKREARLRNSAESADNPSPLVPPFPPAPPIPPIIPPTRSEISFGAGDLEAKLREAAGWQSQPAPNLCVTGEIAALIAAGAILETDVLPVVKAHAPRVRRPSSWRYFVPIIQDAVQARKAAGTGPPQAGEVVPFNATSRSQHGPRPQTIAAGFDLINREIERAERALAEAQGRDGSGQDDPVALP